jgi:hypothetical protein
MDGSIIRAGGSISPTTLIEVTIVIAVSIISRVLSE